MSYGHASWIPIVVFGGMFLIRYLGSQRRRGGPPVGGPGPQRPFTGTDPRGMGEQPAAPPPSGEGKPSGGMPAGWFRDPFVRHEQRFWSGSAWTDHVMDSGVPSVDPPPTPPVDDKPV
jgi:Protein of unknown function (DUF2510)